MGFVAVPAAGENRLGRAEGRAALRGTGLCSGNTGFVSLPILARSASLLTLLLEDGAVELDLVSSVLEVDPGLAFGALQLANGERGLDDPAVWHFPLVIVAAGCERLRRLVAGTPTLESSFPPGAAGKLRPLVTRAVQRGCVAERLARQLEVSSPKLAYLSGLLFELGPLVSGTSLPGFEKTQLALWSALQNSLPAEAFAAIAQGASPGGRLPLHSLAGAVQLAESLLRSGEPHAPARSSELASSSAWPLWQELSSGQRAVALDGGRSMARWVADNLPRLSPWDFMAKLQRHQRWE